MNILITGSSGFIGKHLCANLKRQHKLFYVLRLHDADSCLGPKGDAFYFGENNIIELTKFISYNRIDGVIHLASLYIQSHKPTDIHNLIQSNVYFAAAVLQASADANVSWFINVGTIWQNYNVPDFSDCYNPVNLYAATKQSFIDLAKYYIEVYNIKFCTLKLCDTYGEDDPRKKIFNYFKEASKAEKPVDMSPGFQKMDVLHIDDVVSGFIALIELLSSNCTYRSEYVLSSGMQYSLRELAANYERKFDVKLKINWGGRSYREREVMVPYKGVVVPKWKPTMFL